MEIPRELIYEDRKVINDFRVEDESSVNHLIYLWLLERPELHPEKPGYSQRTLRAFNDAHYMCTMALMARRSENSIPYFKERIREPSVVFPMVYFYIFNINRGSVKYLVKTIETYASTDSILSKNLGDIKKILESWEDSVPASLFERRKLTSECLSTIDWKVWSTCSDHFKPDSVKGIISFTAYNKDEQEMIAEAIKNAAKQAEEDFYNPEPYVEEDEYADYYPSPDDDGSNWTPDYSDVYRLCDNLSSGNEYVGRQANRHQQDDDLSADYSETVAKLREQIDKLEKENAELKETIDLLNTNLGNIDVVSKIGLTLILKLMENDGANTTIHGNKNKAAKALMMMTGKPENTCKAIFSEPLKTNTHRRDVEKLNSLLAELGMNTRI